MNKDLFKYALNKIHTYIDKKIHTIDLTKYGVTYSYSDEQCMIHLVSTPENEDKLIVVCHYISEKAGDKLSECLLEYLGYIPEMPKYIIGRVRKGNLTTNVFGFLVNKNEPTPEMQVL